MNCDRSVIFTGCSVSFTNKNWPPVLKLVLNITTPTQKCVNRVSKLLIQKYVLADVTITIISSKYLYNNYTLYLIMKRKSFVGSNFITADANVYLLGENIQDENIVLPFVLNANIWFACILEHRCLTCILKLTLQRNGSRTRHFQSK